MNKELLEYVNKAKYLGHVIHCTSSDDDDIERQTKGPVTHTTTTLPSPTSDIV